MLSKRRAEGRRGLGPGADLGGESHSVLGAKILSCLQVSGWRFELGRSLCSASSRLGLVR